MALKKVSYKGFHPPITTSVIKYVVLGKEVFFTATEPPSEATSTINAAEEIVEVISAAEKIKWQDFVFYDVRTRVGYPFHKKGFYLIEKLIIRDVSGRPGVKGWDTVAGLGDHDLAERIQVSKLSVILEVLKLFKKYIEI